MENKKKDIFWVIKILSIISIIINSCCVIIGFVLGYYFNWLITILSAFAISGLLLIPFNFLFLKRERAKKCFLILGILNLLASTFNILGLVALATYQNFDEYKLDN